MINTQVQSSYHHCQGEQLFRRTGPPKSSSVEGVMVCDGATEMIEMDAMQHTDCAGVERKNFVDARMTSAKG
jgi:hypothetical protein